ncbi:MAG TPA: discoidin domain-containing protein [Opitutaceae bacterium]|nr:discoidin domain-containing protein [Opitutaceae bacterium]
MKYFTSFLMSALATGTLLTAAPFDPARVSADTKWLAHVDLDGLKESKVGSFIIARIKSELAKKDQAKLSIDFDGMLQQIHSLTAYGTSFEDSPENHSVLLVQAGPKAQSIVEGFLAGQELANDGKVPFKTVTGKAFPTYLFGNEIYLTFPRKDLILVSRQFDQVERALSVIDGRLAPIKRSDPLIASTNPSGFFFIASANGFNRLKEMPAQARLLQKAAGVQVALGETGSNLAARVTLLTTDSEVSTNMTKVVEGMLAMASFVQIQDQNLSRLTQSVTVDQSDKAVSIGLTYPSEEVVKLLTTLATEHRASNATAPAAPAAPEVADSIGGAHLKVNNVDARSDNGNLARNATDSKPETYWAAKGSMQWIRCELESPSLLREVRIAWKDGDTRKIRFSIQTSTNGSQWKTLVTRTSSGSDSGLESYNIPDTATQWVRIMVPSSSGDGVTAISDLQFFGDANVALPPAPVALQ